MQEVSQNDLKPNNLSDERNDRAVRKAEGEVITFIILAVLLLLISGSSFAWY